MLNKSRLSIEGGAVLNGTVASSGAKNAALPILAACLMVEGDYVIHNVPDLADIRIIIRMLMALGVHAEFFNPNSVRISNTKSIKHIAPYDLVISMRASFFVAGPLLARNNIATVPLPGGCAIGARPLDIHLKGFRALGADVSIEHGFIKIKADELKPASILLDFPSVGATENIMMAASRIEGETVIENAAMEPEIVDLGNFLIQAGVTITGLGTSKITVSGVPKLVGQDYHVIADRIEVGTLMIAGAITGGDVTVTGVVPEHLKALSQKLIEMGAELTFDKNSVRVVANGRLKAINLETLPFPGFPTDMQAQMMALLVLSDGTSVVKETIFENRFMHAGELQRMGATINVDAHSAVVTGVDELSGAEVKITDLRAGAALILAGLAASGETQVYGLHHLERGYENFPEKLRQLGATISG